MNDSTLLAVAFLLPLLAAGLVVLCGRRPDLREGVSIAGATALFVCNAVLLAGVADGARPSLTLAEPLPGIALRLTLEPLGALFACLASFLWIVTTVYSIGYMRGHHEKNQTRFYAWFAVALFAVMGAAGAGNLLTLFVFYEALTLSTWPLVTHSGSEAAVRAGRIYLGILLGTSIGLLLLAILWTHAVAHGGTFLDGGLLAGALEDGSLSPTAATVLFTVFAFGIGKAALMPFHRWLPAAMVAPAPVSALLHAVAVVKTGVFALLKVAVYVFGIDGLREAGASIPVAYLAAFTMVAASLVAITRDSLKERLAYSTIAQLSFIVLGTASATAAGMVGAGLHMVTHAFGKITLFFVAGAVMVAANRTQVATLNGLGRVLPFTFVAFTVSALSIVGVPPLAGTWSKWWLGTGLTAPEDLPLLLVLLGSSLLSAAYLLPVAFRAFAPLTPPSGADPEDTTPATAPLPCKIAMGITAAGCVVLFFALGPLQRLLEGVMR